MFVLARDVVEQESQPIERRQELLVAFQGGVHLGTVDEHGDLRVIDHIGRREGVADQIAGEAPDGSKIKQPGNCFLSA